MNNLSLVDSEYELKSCPFCGYHATFWQDEIKTYGDNIITRYAVMCSNSGDSGKESDCECIMYTVSEVAYCDTEKEAMILWNTRAKKLMTEEKKNEKN